MAGTIPGGDRAAKWNLKYDPERIKEVTTAGKPTYSAHAAVVFNDQCAMELRVKEVLNLAGVSVLAYVGYLAYARELWSKCKKFAGETLAKEAATLTAKAVARGLTQVVCQNIRSGVFNIPAPTRPPE
jgi:hypothetical protein